MDKIDFGLKESMENDLINFVRWCKETNPNLLPNNFDYGQDDYSKDRELIKAYLKLNKKQYEEISKFSLGENKNSSSKKL